MDYNGIPCPVCGERMNKNDDIVVCPECATPHHRSCWVKTGHCANEKLHSDGFVWRKNNVDQKAIDGQGNLPPEHAEHTASDSSKICRVCGSENPSDALHCGNCGALFGEKRPDFKVCPRCGAENSDNDEHCKNCGTPLTIVIDNGFFREEPFLSGTDIDPNEDINGNTASELSFFIQASSKRYIPKFRRISQGKRLSFNWAAFFFSPYWFIGRKMYKAGIFVLAVFASFSMFTSSIATDFLSAYNEAVSPYYNTQNGESGDLFNLSEEELADAMNVIYEKTHVQANRFFAVMGISLLIRLVLGLSANGLYYKKVCSTIATIKQNVSDKNLRKLMYTRKGGFSFLNFFSSVVGYNLLINLLIYSATLIGG